MSKKTYPLAVLVSDWHIRITAPSARAEQDNWKDVMSARLKHVRDTASKYSVPTIVAGDIFDKACPSVATISYAMDELKLFKEPIYTVFGNHDASGHNANEVASCGYGVLAKAGVIVDLPTTYWTLIGHANGNHRVAVWPMPWGFDGAPDACHHKCEARLIVMHKYLWQLPEHKHPEAGTDSHVTGLSSLAGKADAILSGDNHQQFLCTAAGMPLFNHGGLMPTNTTQKNYKPSLGLLMSDGSIELEAYHPSADAQWISTDVPSMPKLSAGLVSSLTDIESESVDFPSTVRVMASKCKREGSKTILASVCTKMQEAVA